MEDLKPSGCATGSRMHISFLHKSILAGSVSGIASTALVYPFDVLRTKMQASAQHQQAQSSSSATTTRAHLKGPVQVLSQTWQNGGLRALYTGISLPLAAQAIYKATVFSTNEFCKNVATDYRTWQQQHPPRDGTEQQHPRIAILTMTDHFLCGFTGGAINAAAFVTPVEFIRNQLILHHHHHHSGSVNVNVSGQTRTTRPVTGPMDVIRSTISTHGISGLWRGLGMTVARDSLGCGCFFVSLAYCRQSFHSYYYVDEEPSSPLGVTIVSGMVAGLAFWTVALPLDTLKTWVQEGSSASLTARGAISDSITRHGPGGTLRRLCHGWQVAFGRGAPSAALTIYTYDLVYQKLETL